VTLVTVKIMVNVYMDRQHTACKCYSIYLEDSDGRPASNRRPILKFMSDFYVTVYLGS